MSAAKAVAPIALCAEQSRGFTKALQIKETFCLANPNLPDCPLTHVSQGFSVLTGYGAEEVIGKNCRFLQGPGTDPAAVTQLRDAVKARRVVTMRLLNYRKDGTAFLNQITISPICDSQARPATVRPRTP